MAKLATTLPTETWITLPWEKYLEAIENPIFQNSKSYYYRGSIRIEMLPVSFDHGKSHVIIAAAIAIFTAFKRIPGNGLDTTSFRKIGIGECQPDLAYYLENQAQVIPNGTGVVNLDQYPAPDLVIEIAKSSLLDDLGIKRSLYEELGVKEYWIIDVNTTEIIAYTILKEGLGSQQIRQSQVLTGLNLSLLEEALRRNRETNQSAVLALLMNQF
ncbi:MAG: Uma2 family endonuclease [Microcoleaceae cyanobacterium]